MKKWECTVCGYIHSGEEPPEECPVCGADKSKFVEVTEDIPEPAQEKGEASAAGTPGSEGAEKRGPVTPIERPEPPKTRHDRFQDALIRYHAHPISIHIPNGVLPISILFLLFAILFCCSTLQTAAFYNMVIVLLAMPAVIYTGYFNWQRKYKAARTDLFLNKMICAGLVTILAVMLTMWWIIDPDIAVSPGSSRWIFLLLHLVMFGLAAYAGYLGGKLVFKE